MTSRPPAVAGSFYPAHVGALAALVDQLLADARPDEAVSPPKALISPHAGYIYSGSTAALGFAALRPETHPITRVVVAGPAHRVGLAGIALPGCDRLATPLGEVEVDAAAVEALSQLPQVYTRPDVHADEHSIEVQLPFLQRTLGQFSVVPLAVGEVTPEVCARVLDEVWGGPETLIVISSDLSHYQPYEQARRQDAETLRAIETLQGPISTRQACGAHPVNGLLATAAGRRLRPVLLGACNSGDTAGGRDRVVGYSCFAWYEGRP